MSHLYPLNLGFAADMLHNNVLRGVTTVLLRKFDEAGMLDTIEREKITLALVIKSTFDRLVDFPALEKYDLSFIRYFNATSATRDASKGIKRLKKLKGFKARFWKAYGSTEGGGWVTFCSPRDIERGLEDPKYADVFKSVGREAMLCRIDCVDDDGNPLLHGEIGEMVISAPWLFSGYRELPEQTREVLRDGYLFTGDLARKDENGFVYLEGRKRDMIKSGGINVYPAEIEQIIRGHRKVAEAAVVGVPDEHWGEKVVACIVQANPARRRNSSNTAPTNWSVISGRKRLFFMTGCPWIRPGKFSNDSFGRKSSSVCTFARSRAPGRISNLIDK
ncbi:MAG: fatty acid--CoA ligase family protein [Pseudomonadota bacterium]